MQLNIDSHDFPMTGGLRMNIQRLLQIALSGYDKDIEQIFVRLSDTKGSCDGRATRCHLQIKFARYHDVIVEAIEPVLYVAIDRAANRARRIIRYRLTCWRDQIRNPSLGHRV